MKPCTDQSLEANGLATLKLCNLPAPFLPNRGHKIHAGYLERQSRCLPRFPLFRASGASVVAFSFNVLFVSFFSLFLQKVET